MKTISICKAAILLVPLLWVDCAHAHGIAGNRYFDGTLTFDDPAVADEAILPYYANLSFSMQDSNVSERRINWAFARLLTPTLAVTVEHAPGDTVPPASSAPCRAHRCGRSC